MKQLPKVIKVTVTEADMIGAQEGNGNRCPIANGIYRVCGDGVSHVNVGRITIRLSDVAGERRLVFPSSDAARAFIDSFDGKKPGPFPTLTLDTTRARIQQRKKVVRSVKAKKTSTVKVPRPSRSTASQRLS